MSKIIDETGNIYGFLTVLEKAPLPNRKKSGWLCSCSLCGGTKVISGSDLRANKYTSCGCKKQNIIQEIPGTRYNDLEVIEQDPTPARSFADNCIHWYCKCLLCGSIVSISGRNLRNGQTSSCGCSKSYGERIISRFLEENNISYKKEFSFSDLKDKQKLRFDFAIFNSELDKNIPILLLEFNGIQHFQKNNNFYIDNPAKFDILKEHDELKKEYCLCNSKIPLVVISNQTGITNRKVLKDNVDFILDYIFTNLKENKLYGKILTVDCGDVEDRL